MEISLEIISDSLGEESLYRMSLVESDGNVIITLATFDEDRIIEVDSKQLRKALEAIKEDD